MEIHVYTEEEVAENLRQKQMYSVHYSSPEVKASLLERLAVISALAVASWTPLLLVIFWANH